MKAVGYIRVSSREQIAGTSLGSQEQAIQAFCSRDNTDLLEVFREEGESAKTADRTELQRMIGYCAAVDVDLVLVWKFDRFARNLKQHLDLRSKLLKLGVEVRSVTEPVSGDPAGHLLENMLAAFAQFDNDVRAQRAKTACRARALEGRWICGPPIGYRKGRHRGLLEPDAQRACFVREAFDLVGAGRESIDAVRHQLTRRGFRTPRGKAVSKQTFHRMLRNPIYAGRIVLPTYDVDAPSAFDALVDEETFDAVQERLSGREPRRRSGDDDFPLRRFAFCAVCSTPFTGAITRSKGKAYGYYRCPNCNGTNIRRRALHDCFVEQLDFLSLDRRLVPMFREVALGAFRSERRRRGHLARRLSAELGELEGQEQIVRRAFIYDQRIGRDVYEDELARIQGSRREVETEFHGIREPSIEPEFVVSRAEAVVVDPGGTWKRLTGATKQREFQRIVFPEGVPVQNGECLKPCNSPIFSTLRALERGELERGSPNGI